MRVMMLLKADKNSEAGTLPTWEHLVGMGKLVEDMAKAGVLLAADGLHPSAKGKRIAYAGGKITSVTEECELRPLFELRRSRLRAWAASRCGPSES